MDVKCFSIFVQIFVQNKYVVVTVKNTLCKLSIVMNNRIHASRVFYCHESKQAALPLNGRAALIILRLLSEGIAGCLSALTCTFSGNIHMFCMTFIIFVIHAVARFTINADGMAGMFQGAYIRIPRTFAGKALTACIAPALRMLAAYGNIPFAATFTLVIYAVFHTAV